MYIKTIFQVSRSLLIRSLPDRLASIECLMSIFYQFGDITSVRVLRPGKEIPHDLRDGLGKLILTDIAAVVEFETTESAANAFHRFSINNEIAFDNVPYELNVSLMGTGMEEELDSGKFKTQIWPNPDKINPYPLSSIIKRPTNAFGTCIPDRPR